jgi:hypothetical protein
LLTLASTRASHAVSDSPATLKRIDQAGQWHDDKAALPQVDELRLELLDANARCREFVFAKAVIHQHDRAVRGAGLERRE